jgi:quinol monooxygenase YgiN
MGDNQPIFGMLSCITKKTNTMERFAILARVEAKPGKETDVLAFLKSALGIAMGETGTVRWYALQLGPSTFGIFDTFESTDGRTTHLNGQIAAALVASASELLSKEPVIEMVDLIAVK